MSGRDLSGAARLEGHWDDDATRCPVGTGDTSEQEFGRSSAEFLGVLRDRRDPRDDEVGRFEMVERHERDLVLESQPVKGSNRPGGGEILRREHRRRTANGQRGEELHGRVLCFLDARDAGSNHRLGTRVLDRRIEPFPSRSYGRTRITGAEEGDGSVTVGEQVFGGEERASAVVAADDVGVQDRLPVDEHDWGPALELSSQGRSRFGTTGDDRQPVHPARREGIDQSILLDSNLWFLSS